MAKILLVEDDNNLREIYEARLQAEGYDIASARDGEEALVIAKNEQPDLIISDVMMPKISGFEMLDILRNTEGLQHVKVIMLTALGQTEDQTRANNLGADRYLVKSQVTLEDIVNVSQQLLISAGAITAPATPTADAATPAPAPAAAAAPEPVAPAEPAAATPVTVPEPAAAPAPSALPTPVIPLAAAPPEETADSSAGTQMPPTPASTIPDMTVADAATPAPAPAAAAAPEPVAPAEPAAATPVTVPEPAAAPAPSAPVASDAPQTSAEEEAAVEQQIETFVENQPATPPAQVEPTDSPVAVEPETTAPETAAPVAQPTAAQEQALNEALTHLGGDTASAPIDPAPAGLADVAVATPERKRIIQPLSNETPGQKSLDQLLAEEEAKSGNIVSPAATPTASVTPPVTPEPISQPVTPPVVDEPKTPPANPNDFDPNSIAL